jgi:hypothetical protein
MATESRAEDRAVATDVHAALERALIQEYLRERGHSGETVSRLPSGEQARLLRAASSCASLRLAEMESRARLLEELE